MAAGEEDGGGGVAEKATTPPRARHSVNTSTQSGVFFVNVTTFLKFRRILVPSMVG